MDWPYLAGFTDGEGSIKMYKRDYPRITWGQKERLVLDEIKTFLGLSNAITLSRDCHYLQVCDRQTVLHIIRNIYPHSIVKRPDMDAVLARWVPDQRGV
jgi:hypothetical protein